MLAAVIILAIHLRRRQLRDQIVEGDKLLPEPITRPSSKPSFSRFYRQRLSEFSIPETEEDEVFEEGTFNASQVTLSLFHIPNDERLVLDIWSVAQAPGDLVTGYVEAQLFPSDFEAGQFRTNVRESVDNVVIFNESFVIPDVSSEVLTRVYLKLFLFACEGVKEPQCVGHAVFSLRNIQWSPEGKTQFKKELIQVSENILSYQFM